MTGDRGDGEVAHLIDKSSPEVVDLVGVGVGLSLALGGVLSQSEQYCDQANIEEDLMLLCLAAQNKMLTVLLSVWLPIILYCLIGNYKVETLPRTNTARWGLENIIVQRLYFLLFSQLTDIGQEIDVRNIRGFLSQNQFIDDQKSDYEYLLW